MMEENIRPWGRYDILLNDTNVKVKKITVKPQARLSLQMHNYRNENWVIVNGEGEVTLDKKITQIRTGESCYIPAKSKHRIKNTSLTENLIFIEVQTGSYFGEDDIVRFEDDWQRK